MRNLLILILLSLGFGFIFAWSSYDSNNVADMHNLFNTKMYLLGNVTEQNRIIVSGGSNAFFGLSSETMEKLLRKKVINISMPAEAYDSRLMQILTFKAVKEGDVVLYSSLEFWRREDINANKYLAASLAEKLKASEYSAQYSYKKLYKYWQPFPQSVNPATFLMQKFRPNIELSAADYINNIDKHGDYLAAKTTTTSVIPFKLTGKGNPAVFIKNMKRFERELATKGVKLVVLIPWILINQNEKEEWNKHYQEITKELNLSYDNETGYADIALRTNRGDFSDAAAHLTRQMAKVRAEYVSKNTVRTNMFPKVKRE